MASLHPSSSAIVLRETSRARAAWVDWLPLIVLPAATLLVAPSTWPRWGLMWSLAIAIYVGCKWLTWCRSKVDHAPWWQHAGYLLAWPGLDADAFLRPPDRSAVDHPSLPAWLSALAMTAAGVLLFFQIVPPWAEEFPLLAGWAGFASILMMLHFGSFQLLSCAWRMIGVRAAPLMNNPAMAQSLSDYWGRRWNTAFRDLTHKFLFRPLASHLGAKSALFVGFVFSGLVHDLVISVPAEGGYGGPTLFFIIQAAAIFAERSAWGKRLGLGRGWRGWFFTMVVLIGPVWLLFHPPFAMRVIQPFVLDVTSLGF